jgi:hypothetical protein
VPTTPTTPPSVRKSLKLVTWNSDDYDDDEEEEEENTLPLDACMF